MNNTIFYVIIGIIVVVIIYLFWEKRNKQNKQRLAYSKLQNLERNGSMDPMIQPISPTGQQENDNRTTNFIPNTDQIYADTEQSVNALHQRILSLKTTISQAIKPYSENIRNHVRNVISGINDKVAKIDSSASQIRQSLTPDQRDNLNELLLILNMNIEDLNRIVEPIVRYQVVLIPLATGTVQETYNDIYDNIYDDIHDNDIDVPTATGADYISALAKKKGLKMMPTYQGFPLLNSV